MCLQALSELLVAIVDIGSVYYQNIYETSETAYAEQGSTSLGLGLASTNRPTTLSQTSLICRWVANAIYI